MASILQFSHQSVLFINCPPSCAQIYRRLPSSLYLSHQTWTRSRSPITCARKRTGSKPATRFILESIYVIASNLNILPQPLDLIIGQLTNRGGNGSIRGFYARRSKAKKQLWWLGFVVIGSVAVLFEREMNIAAFCGVLGFCAFLVALVKKCNKKVVKDLVSWMCCLGILVSLGSQKWVGNGKYKLCPPVMEIVTRRKGSRAFLRLCLTENIKLRCMQPAVF